MKKILWILIFSLIMSPSVFAQVIKLKSGQTIKGKIIEKTKRYIVVDQGLGTPVTYYMDVEKELIEEPKPEPAVPDQAPGQPTGDQGTSPATTFDPMRPAGTIAPDLGTPQQPTMPNTQSYSTTTQASPQASQTPAYGTIPQVWGDGPLPEIPYDRTNPNVTEAELKGAIEVYSLAYNSHNTRWLSEFMGEARYFSPLTDYKYDLTGDSYLNMLKLEWSVGRGQTMTISVDKIELQGPQATTEETISQKRNDATHTYRQKNIYVKSLGKLKLLSSELLTPN